MQKLTPPHWPEIWFKPTWMGCAALILDSSWRVLPCLKIGVNCRCRGLYRRGGLVTGGGKGKPRWIVLSYEVSGGY